MKKIAVFASGNGSNFQVLAEKFKENIAFLFSDNPNAYAIERAKTLAVPYYSFSAKSFPTKIEFEVEILKLLKKHSIDLILLAGYMKIIGSTLLEAYPKRIINIHPSYLPDYKGAHAILDAWQAGAGGGVTVHYIDSGIDTGEIITQAKVAYQTDYDKFEASIHELEYQLYPKVIQEILEK
jgi:phosphoribosylglycinamide formyltransferase-1